MSSPPVTEPRHPASRIGVAGARLRALAAHVPARVRLVLGLLGCVLAGFGVYLMRDQDPYTLIGSLSTGFLADIFPSSQWVLTGTACTLVGAMLIFLCLPQYAPPDVAAPPAAAQPAARQWAGWRSREARPIAASTLLAVVLFAFVLLRALNPEPSRLTFFCLAGAIVFAAIAIRLALPGSSVPDRRARLTLIDVGIILAIIAAFIIVNARDFRDWHYAFIGDEWSFYTVAKAIANGYPADMLSQGGVYGYHPVLNSVYQALIMHLAGVNVAGWRLASTLSPALPIVALYWGAKHMAGSLYAAVAAVIYASCSLLWAYAHIGYNTNDPLLAIIPAAALCYVGLRDDRPVLLFLAGVAAGFGWYTLFTGRLMIGVLLVVLISEWGGPRVLARRALQLLGGFALPVLPFVLENKGDTFSQMVTQTTINGSGGGHTLILQNAVRGIYAFLIATENDHYISGALFDVCSAAALVAGIVIALRSIRLLSSRLLLCWYALLLAAITPFFYAPQIPDTRLEVVIPPAALLAALGLCAAAQAAQKALTRREHGPLLYIVPAIALAAILGANLQRFYVDIPKLQPPSLIAMTIGAATSGPPAEVILTGNTSNYNLCQVLDGFEVDPAAVLFPGAAMLDAQCPDYTALGIHRLPAVLVVVNDQTRLALPRCAARLQPLVHSPDGTQTLWGYRFAIPLEPAATYQARLRQMLNAWCPTLPGPPH